MRRALVAWLTWAAGCFVLVPAWADDAPSPRVLMMLRSPTAHARIDGGYTGAGYVDASREASQRRVGARIALAHGFEVVTQWPMPSLGLDCLMLRPPIGTSVDAGIAALQSHPEVAWAQPVNVFEAQGHVDPLYAMQPAAGAWRLDALHAVATGRGMRVALIDSGVDEAHPDLAQSIETRRNFVDGQAWVAERHGTAVAGLISARADNGIGIVGVAPGARLLALRACREVDERRTLCDTLSLAKALDFAIGQHAEVINMSLSGPFDRLLARLIDLALSHGQQLVAAVDRQAAGGGFPAAYPGVYAVADASDTGPGGPAGAWSAPAHDLPTTAPGGGWRLVSGTSFAAGQVSGLLAVLAEARADRRPPEPAMSLVRLSGGGIDACASLMRVLATNRGAPASTNGCQAVLSQAGGSVGP